MADADVIPPLTLEATLDIRAKMFGSASAAAAICCRLVSEYFVCLCRRLRRVTHLLLRFHGFVSLPLRLRHACRRSIFSLFMPP